MTGTGTTVGLDGTIAVEGIGTAGTTTDGTPRRDAIAAGAEIGARRFRTGRVRQRPTGVCSAVGPLCSTYPRMAK